MRFADVFVELLSKSDRVSIGECGNAVDRLPARSGARLKILPRGAVNGFAESVDILANGSGEHSEAARRV